MACALCVGQVHGHRREGIFVVFDVNIMAKMRTFADAPALRRFALLIEAHMLGPQDDDDVGLAGADGL